MGLHLGSQGTRRGNISWGTEHLGCFRTGSAGFSMVELLEISLGLVVGPAVGMLGTRRGNIAWGGAVLSGRPAGEITRAGGWACTWEAKGPKEGEHQLGHW